MANAVWDIQKTIQESNRLIAASEEIYRILMNSKTIVAGTASSFDGEAGKKFRQKFDALEKDFQNFKKDIESFGAHMKSYGEGMQHVTAAIDESLAKLP